MLWTLLLAARIYDHKLKSLQHLELTDVSEGRHQSHIKHRAITRALIINHHRTEDMNLIIDSLFPRRDQHRLSTTLVYSAPRLTSLEAKVSRNNPQQMSTRFWNDLNVSGSYELLWFRHPTSPETRLLTFTPVGIAGLTLALSPTWPTSTSIVAIAPCKRRDPAH